MAEKRGFGGFDLDQVASGSAVVISLGTAVYTYHKVIGLAEEIQEIKGHLSAIAPQVDPALKQGLQRCFQSIQILDREIAKIKTQSGNSSPQVEAPKPVREAVIKKYVRLTKPDSSPELIIPTQEEDDPDVAEAVAALST